jgi:hypothetical protein
MGSNVYEVDRSGHVKRAGVDTRSWITMEYKYRYVLPSSNRFQISLCGDPVTNMQPTTTSETVSKSWRCQNRLIRPRSQTRHFDLMTSR